METGNKIKTWAYQCRRCYHIWLTREEKTGDKTYQKPSAKRPRAEKLGPPPRVCPNCKSPYWANVKQDKAQPEKPKS